MILTALYASLLAILLIALSYKVVNQRRKNSVGIGDGDNEALSLAIRVQANFTEYVPTALILLGIFEFNGGNSTVIHLCGSLLFIARVFHASGLASSRGTTFGRFYGILITWLVILSLSVANIFTFLSVQGLV